MSSAGMNIRLKLIEQYQLWLRRGTSARGLGQRHRVTTKA